LLIGKTLIFLIRTVLLIRNVNFLIIMFSKCPKKCNSICPHAGEQDENLHCGFIAAPFRATMVENLPDCPLKMTKYQVRKYVKGRIWKN